MPTVSSVLARPYDLGVPDGYLEIVDDPYIALGSPDDAVFGSKTHQLGRFSAIVQDL
jgi:hypothetical protein